LFIKVNPHLFDVVLLDLNGLSAVLNAVTGQSSGQQTQIPRCHEMALGLSEAVLSAAALPQADQSGCSVRAAAIARGTRPQPLLYDLLVVVGEFTIVAEQVTMALV
jgi:hypothetical protein